MSGGDIWLMNADGSGRTQLTSSTEDSPAQYSQPAWAPDGSKLAYVASDDTGGQAVYVSDADGKNARKLVDGAADPAWSPDGTKIAFSNDDGDTTAIFVISPSGGTPSKLCAAAGFLNEPAWSPDGKQIAYRLEAVEGESDTTLIASATGCVTASSTGADDSEPSYAWNFALAFSRSDDNSDQDIFVKPRTGDATDVSRSEGSNDWSPAFSPDGTKIVFVSNRDGNDEIYLMSADGSGQVNLTNDPVDPGNGDCPDLDETCDPGAPPPDDTDPAWQPR